MVDPYANPDARWRRGVKGRRRRRGFPMHVVYIGIALVVLGGGLVFFLLQSAPPEKQLEERAREFEADWGRLAFADLWERYAIPDDAEYRRWRKIFRYLEWLERRPEIRFRSAQTAKVVRRRSARTHVGSTFHGCDAVNEPVTVRWERRHDRWLVVGFRIPRPEGK